MITITTENFFDLFQEAEKLLKQKPDPNSNEGKRLKELIEAIESYELRFKEGR